MTRPSPHTTVFTAALIFAFTAQSLLLAPNINTHLYTSIPTVRVTIGGWMFFLASLALATTFALNPQKILRNIIFLVATGILGILGLLYFKQNMLMGAVTVWGLAIGFLVITWGPVPNFDLIVRDWLPVFVLAINTVVGLGFLFRSVTFFPATFQAPFRATGLLLGVIFILPTLLGIFFYYRNQKLLNGLFIRILAIPWIIWSLYAAVYIKDVSALIPPACLFFTLLVVGLIPWEMLHLPPQDVLGHRVLIVITALNILSLALLSTFTRGVIAHLTIPINTKMYLLNLIVLTFNLIMCFSYAMVGYIILAINGLTLYFSLSTKSDGAPDALANFPAVWTNAINRLLKPFKEIQAAHIAQLQTSAEEIQHLAAELNKGKRRLTQLTLVNELEQQLKPILDPPVVAQLTVNAIQRAYDLILVTIFTYDFPRHEFVSLAIAGKGIGRVPPEYRQSIQKGLIGRAARLHKTQYAPDTRLDSDYFSLDPQPFLSEAAIPLLYQGLIKGMLVVDHDQTNAFNIMDLETLEAISNLLLASWNRSNYDERLRGLIRAGITLTTTLETDVAIQEIATTVQQTLAARFVFVALMDQQRIFNGTASAGYAPRLINYLNINLGANTIVQTVVNSTRVHRMHDIRKLDGKINLDNVNLRGFLGFPIRMRGQRIGAIMAFGKQGGIYFSEEDESLATLISNQAAASIEATWLYQQLSTSFNTTTRLYDLSNAILKTETLGDAAAAVAEAAFKLGNAKITGIVLFNPQREIEAQVQIDAEGLHTRQGQPMALIKQALNNNRTMMDVKEQIATVCIPLATPHRQYGVLWLNIPEIQWPNQRYSDDLHTLANQAALALERGILLDETQQQREQIQAAYRELEITYDQTLIALSSAVDARDRETEGHCVRVSKLTYHLGKQLGLPIEQLKSLERGALLHDIGKIGISDNILLKPGPLNEDEWHAMRQHPDIGARMIEGIPFLQDAIPVIRYHQERWDGSGYPIGLKGEEIPLQARVFAVADVFDALTSTRPYRQRVTINEAIRHIRSNAGKDFDPRIVDVLEEMAKEAEINKYLAQ